MTIHCVSNPSILLMAGKVGKRSRDNSGIVTKKANCGVAPSTEKSSYRASLMVVIYRKALLNSCFGLGYANSLAYRAAAILICKQRIVFHRLNAKLLAPTSVRAKSVVLLTVFLAPLRLLITRTRLAKTLKPIDLTACLKELGLVFYRFTSSAPLHTFGSFRATGRASVVPLQVVKGFTLDPSQVLSVPGCNWRWTATSALAQAFRYFGHHASPLLAYFSNNTRGKE